MAERELGVGEYFGEAVRRRQAYGFVLTENQFRAGVVIPRHRHVLAHFTCILAGGFVETYDDRVLECPKGTILLVPANRIHSDEVGAEGAHTLSIELSPKNHKRISETSGILEEPAVLADKPVARLVDRLYAEFRAQDAASLLMLSSLSLEMLATAERTLERASGPAWMPAAMSALHRGLDQGISLSKLAAEVGVHEAHLARSFRRIHGCSVGEYIRFLKLEQAKAKLSSTELSLAEIALDAGFYDQAHFSREFRKTFGTTPSQYRKMMS